MPPPSHRPVLLDRVVALLAPALSGPEPVLVDATVGLGGHAAALLQQCPAARLVGVDRDRQALAVAEATLARFADRVRLVPAGYDALDEVLAGLRLERVHAILFDLGLSSLQVDDPARGFSYAADAPLDMRMDQAGGQTAAEVVNNYPAAELASILRRYGEERHAARIARAIVAERAEAPFTTSGRLVEVVRRSLPAQPTRRGHPAKRVFQALRIEVNGELDRLRRALPTALAVLATQGRIAVLSYHSLEDRLVKRTFAERARPSVPPGLPVVPADRQPELRLLTRGAERPEAAEVAANRRAASARLRVAERVREAA